MMKICGKHEQNSRYLAAPYSALERCSLSRCLEALDLVPRSRQIRPRRLSTRAGSLEIIIVRLLPVGGHGYHKLIYYMINIIINKYIHIFIECGGEAVQSYLRWSQSLALALALQHRVLPVGGLACN